MQPSDLIVFVPTRGNKKFLLKMAEQLQGIRRTIFLTSQVDITHSEVPGNCLLVAGGTRLEKRQRAIRMAHQYGIDYCVQIDDDLRGPLDQLAANLVTVLEQNPSIGSVSSQSRVMLGMGWLPSPVSHDFVVKPYPSQLLALRLQAYRETKGFRTNTLEDVDIGAQMWNIGWGVAATVGKISYSEIRPHDTRDPNAGGMPNSEFQVTMYEDIALIRGMTDILKVAEFRPNKKGEIKIVLRWHWQTMLDRYHERWGVPYSDSRHRVGLLAV